MKLAEVLNTLKTNVEQLSFIKTVELQGNICKSPTGDDEITHMVLTFDDSVDTKLIVMAINNRLVIQLSQLEVPQPQPKFQRTYLDSSATCKGIE